jgi:TonB-dependent receptor
MRILIFSCMLVVGVTLTAIAQTSRISGVVADTWGPLPGVRVALDTTRKVTTDAEGRFAFYDLSAGVHRISVYAAGFDVADVEVVLGAAQAVDLGIIRLHENRQLQEIVVSENLSGREVKAVSIMRLASRQMSVLAAEGMAKLPDRNAAEAIQRLAGVVMERDQGEGRWVSFRGTPADWGSALINGDRMPVADEENKTRALNFDILPTSLIEYIVLSRTLTPDMEGDAIGGSANFITREAPTKRLAHASVALGYAEKAGRPLFNGALTYGDRSPNKKFGFLLGAGIYSRHWATDNNQLFYGTNYDQSISRIELRAYNGRRSTVGASAALEYTPSQRFRWYLKCLLGSARDLEYNRKVIFAYNPGIGQSIKIQNINDLLTNRFLGGSAGGSYRKEGNRLDWKIATYNNRFRYGNIPFPGSRDPRNGYYVVEFEKQVYYTDFLFLDDNGEPTDEYNAAYRYKFLDIDSPVAGYGDNHRQLNPTWRNIIPVVPTDTLFQFVKLYTETNQSRETDPLVAQADFKQTVSSRLSWQTGVKFRSKRGSRRVGLEVWDRNPNFPAAIVYDDFERRNIDRTFLPEFGAPYEALMPPFLSASALESFLPTNADRLRYLPFGVNTPYYNQFIGSSYQYRETVTASYLLAEWHLSEALSVHAGIRGEHTIPLVSADSVIEDIPNSTRYLVKKSAGSRYGALLPMINVRWNAPEKHQWRFGLTRSFRRPNFNELKPGQPSIDYTNFELILGNPGLKPSFSWNVDLNYTRYATGSRFFSTGLFFKQVTNHIYTAFENAGADNVGVSNEFQVPGGVISKKYQNAPSAYAAGVEFSYTGKFTGWSGWGKNLGINANYTLTDARMRIPARTRAQPLPRQSRHLANAALFFENERASVRLACNYKSPYLMELNLFAVKDPNTGLAQIIHQDNDYDTFIGNNLSVDFSGSVKTGRQISLYAEWNNLTNAPLIIYRGRKDRPQKIEYYGTKIMAGIRLNIQ